MKKIIIIMVLALSVWRMGAMQQSMNNQHNVTFLTSDQERIAVPKERARLFGTIKDLLEDVQGSSDIPLANVSAAVLRRSLTDLDWVLQVHKKSPQEITALADEERSRCAEQVTRKQEVVFSSDMMRHEVEHFRAADYLGIPELSEYHAQGVAKMAVSNESLQLLQKNDRDYIKFVTNLSARLKRVAHKYMSYEQWHDEYTIEDEDCVVFAQFSANGERVATASEDHTAQIWRLNRSNWTREKVIQHADKVNTVRFSSDTLVTASADGTSQIWRLKGDEWALEHTIKYRGREDGEQGDFNSARFSSNGEKIAIACRDDETQVWCFKNNKWECEQVIEQNGSVKDVAFSNNGRWLGAALCSAHKAKIMEFNENVWQKKISIQHGNCVHEVEFSPDGQKLATRSEDGEAKIFHLVENKWLEKYVIVHTDEEDDEWVSSIHFSSDGKRLVTSSGNGTAVIVRWNGNDWEQEYVIQYSPKCRLRSAQFSPDGERLVITSNKSTVKVFKRDGNEWLEEHATEHGTSGDYAEFSPKGDRVVTTSDKTAKILRLVSSDHFDQALCMTFLAWAKKQGYDRATDTRWVEDTLKTFNTDEQTLIGKIFVETNSNSGRSQAGLSEARIQVPPVELNNSTHHT